jgi:hypothetical protein
MSTAGATEFEVELNIFRTEQETAEQYFFAYLGIRSLAAQRADVLALMNHNSVFWIISHHALLLSTFIALGRIFDHASKHNVDRLMLVVERNLPIFSQAALRSRKEKVISAEQAREYGKDRHVLSANEVRNLKKQIREWRKVFQARYLPIRHQFAHKRLSHIDEVKALLAKTNVDELKHMFGFLRSLHQALDQLFINGLNPIPLPECQFVLPPEPEPSRQYYPGEDVVFGGSASLADDDAPQRLVRRNGADRRHQPERDRQIVMTPFLRSAGARLTVMRRAGSASPEAISAERTHSRASDTALSGRPAIANAGGPGATCTCTSTALASILSRLRWNHAALLLPRKASEGDAGGGVIVCVPGAQKTGGKEPVSCSFDTILLKRLALFSQQYRGVLRYDGVNVIIPSP